MLIIDGKMGEGGGQILRTSLSCSILTQTPIKIINVRANRKQPGLKAQHLTAFESAAQICDAKVEGAKLGSMEITFSPQKVKAGEYAFNVGTAGSVMLIYQTLLYPLLFASGKSKIKLIGGTHVEWSPSYHYIEKVFLKCAKLFGFNSGLELERPGFYPKGGGKVSGLICPQREDFKPVDFSESGEIKELTLFIYTADLPENISDREVNSFMKNVGYLPQKPRIVKELGSANNPGNILLLVAEYEKGFGGFQSIAQRGKRAETIGKEVANKFRLFNDLQATVDEHLADQLIIPAVLAKGKTVYKTPKVSQHLLTNVNVIGKFFPAEISIEGELEKPGVITVKSKGYFSFASNDKEEGEIK